MEDLKPVIAKNITSLRKYLGMTQAELAQRLNYSDKAVSKWERAESIPDVTVLKQIADLFGVTVDDLLSSERPGTGKVPSGLVRRNRMIITMLSVTLVFLIATLFFVGFGIFKSPLQHLWIIYIYAIPPAAVVLLVFNSLWGGRHRRIVNCGIVSGLTWSILLALYLSFLPRDLRLIFIVGIPAQIIILLWSRLKFFHKTERKPEI